MDWQKLIAEVLSLIGTATAIAVSLKFFMQMSVHMDGALTTVEQNELRSGFGYFAIFTAIRRASSLLSNFATAR